MKQTLQNATRIHFLACWSFLECWPVQFYFSDKIIAAMKENAEYFLGNTGLLHNGILLPKLFWPTALREEIVLVIKKNFWSSRLKAENLQKIWDHSNNSFEQWKVRTMFGNRMLF